MTAGKIYAARQLENLNLIDRFIINSVIEFNFNQKENDKTIAISIIKSNFYPILFLRKCFQKSLRSLNI